MKHSLYRIILVLALGISLCACASDQGASEEPTTLPSTLPNAITYWEVDDLCIPISYVQDGAQLLTGEIRLSDSETDQLLSGAPAVDSLSVRSVAGDGTDIGALLSDGGWEFFPESVDYQTYDWDNQPGNAEWTAYFREKLDALHCDSPVIIQSSASYRSGEQSISFVTASNALPSGPEDGWATQDVLDAARNPENEAPHIYTISALFLSDAPPLELFSHVQEIPKTQNPSEAIAGYVPWEGEELYMQFLSTIQLGTSGKAAAFPVLTNMTGELSLRDFGRQPRCLIADIDGDGSSELVFAVLASSSLFSYCKVFKLEREAARQTLHISLG